MDAVVSTWVAISWFSIGLIIGVLFGCFASQRSLSDIFKKEKKRR